jgi:hypothetical protein
MKIKKTSDIGKMKWRYPFTYFFVKAKIARLGDGLNCVEFELKGNPVQLEDYIDLERQKVILELVETIEKEINKDYWGIVGIEKCIECTNRLRLGNIEAKLALFKKKIKKERVK